MQKILNVDLDHYFYDDSRGDTYLKAKVSDETCFRKDKDKTVNTIPNEKTKYNCRVLLQKQSVYCNNNKMEIIILRYFGKVVDINFLPIID